MPTARPVKPDDRIRQGVAGQVVLSVGKSP
jgi:hypothetical protein